jgi:hypothetical protein
MVELYFQKRHIIYIFLDTFSSRSIWWHYVTITVPRVIRRSKTAFLLIDDGSNGDA